MNQTAVAMWSSFRSAHVYSILENSEVRNIRINVDENCGHRPFKYWYAMYACTMIRFFTIAALRCAALLLSKSEVNPIHFSHFLQFLFFWPWASHTCKLRPSAWKDKFRGICSLVHFFRVIYALNVAIKFTHTFTTHGLSRTSHLSQSVQIKVRFGSSVHTPSLYLNSLHACARDSKTCENLRFLLKRTYH